MEFPLSGYLPEELTERLQLGAGYRGRQLFAWIHKGVIDFAAMLDLPQPLRRELAEKYKIFGSKIEQSITDNDGTIKFRIKLADGQCIEAVLLADLQSRRTVCISSQAGCRMGCRFCRTGQMPFVRNLTASEMVEQFLLINTAYGPVSHLVLMGMGEPLDNLANLRQALALLYHPGGTGINLKRITLSTCGLVEQLHDLAAKGPHVKLAVSLVSAREDVRQQLMPVTLSQPLIALKAALLAYQQQSGKRITLELVLLKGINDTEQEIAALCEFIPPLKVVVNVIPWNPAEGLAFRRPDGSRIEWFKQRLAARGLAVTQRFRRGTGINAACGQLWTRT